MIIGSACVFVLLLDSPGDLTEPVQREQCWSLVRHHQHRLFRSNHLEKLNFVSLPVSLQDL